MLRMHTPDALKTRQMNVIKLPAVIYIPRKAK